MIYFDVLFHILDGLGNEYVDEDFQAELSARHGNNAVSFEEKTPPAPRDGTMTPTAAALINRLAEYVKLLLKIYQNFYSICFFKKPFS